MNIKRLAKLLTWLSNRYPSAYIRFYEDEETAGFDVWDNEDNYYKYSRLDSDYINATKDLEGHFKHDEALYSKWMEDRDRFEKENLKFSLDDLNTR